MFQSHSFRFCLTPPYQSSAGLRHVVAGRPTHRSAYWPVRSALGNADARDWPSLAALVPLPPPADGAVPVGGVAFATALGSDRRLGRQLGDVANLGIGQVRKGCDVSFRQRERGTSFARARVTQLRPGVCTLRLRGAIGREARPYRQRDEQSQELGSMKCHAPRLKPGRYSTVIRYFTIITPVRSALAVSTPRGS